MNQQSVIIIGGGLGGLFLGALLAKNGRRVTVLERGHVIGGGLQTFVRDGHVFETGMHLLGGFQPGGSLYRICHYLGIFDQLDLVRMPSDCLSQVCHLDNGRQYSLPQGREAYTDYLCRQFPAEADGIRRYVDAIYAIADSTDLFNLRQPPMMMADEAHSIAVGPFLQQFTSDEELINVLAFMSTLYGGKRDITPAYVHALINVLYINGTFRFGHSSQQLADALAGVIRQHGGEVLARHEVSLIEVENRCVTRVHTRTGQMFVADTYISSLDPTTTVALCSPGAFPRAYAGRLGSIPHTYSAFKVYYTLRADQFPALDAPVYVLDSQESFWSLDTYTDQWPHGVALFMTQPEADARGERTVMAICPMSFDAVRQWQDSTIGHRPDDYKAWKAAQTQRVTQLIARRFAGFPSAVISSFASTPLTFRDWLCAPEGNMYGFSKDASNPLLSHLPVHTKVSNLLLTGQCINLHGICGVPLTAIQTAEAVLGRDSILSQL